MAEVHLSPKLLSDPGLLTCSKWDMNLIVDYEYH